MKYEYTIKNDKFNRKKIFYIVIIMVVFAIIIGGLFWFINKDNIYDKYNVYDKKNKDIGTIEHYKDETENMYISLYYPKTESEDFNKIINQYYKNYIKEQKVSEKSKDILYMDYSIDEVYDQFINLNLKIEKFNENEKLILSTNKLFSYDLKNNTLLTVDDCLRNLYKTSLAGINRIDKINHDNSNIRIEKSKLIIYTDENLKEKVEINYAENKDLIKLANKNIPSNAPIDVAKPTPQPKIDPNKKIVAITLDDGPHKTNTLRTIELFEKYNGRATFLMLGKNVKLYPDIVKTVYEHGFEIGSHSWDHPDLRKLDVDGVNKQIVDTQNEIFSITGFEPKIIRPPYGATNDISKEVIADNGLKIALWNLDTEDWKLKDANKIKDAIVDNAFNGAVILIHDIHTFTIDGLEMALAELDKRGYQFVTLDTLSQYFELKNVLR
ncbi:peptidoglycan-N-acetylmuramic acid deacetylase PdaC [Thomasclavelia cocleata]|uniref:Peptidoglycan-N-acetylmuramic acid deacetylase PdaC n=1 Tax=Thomasclavelia cocleata TaxID=69824 RepID=A0A829ZEB7_9FIRM|nr:polysaccharide deacetylase family protein [Thomasclavelia cocleata]GFI41708.1 peptidoglycan-N-acetylmuramic acid deacetylase PdaC [Thomasclavelia cocleata]